MYVRREFGADNCNIKGAIEDPCRSTRRFSNKRADNFFPDIKGKRAEGRHTFKLEDDSRYMGTKVPHMPKLANENRFERPKSQRFPRNCFEQYGFFSSDEDDEEDERTMIEARKKASKSLKLPPLTRKKSDKTRKDRFLNKVSNSSVSSGNETGLELRYQKDAANYQRDTPLPNYGLLLSRPTTPEVNRSPRNNDTRTSFYRFNHV